MAEVFEMFHEDPSGDHSDLGAKRPVGVKPHVVISALSTETGGTGDTKPRFTLDPRETGPKITEAPLPTQRMAAAKVEFSVALPMPSNLPQEYAAEWMNDSTNLNERVVSSVVAELDKRSKGDKSAQFEATITSQIKNSIIGLAKTTAFRKTLADRGLAYNPHKEMFYVGPVFRSMSMDWIFSFRNKKEFEVYEEVRRRLAYHMHPEYVDGVQAGVWQIPETFSIEFVNAKIPKFGRCVLTSLQTNPLAAGGWRNHEEGTPSHIEMRLSFMELEPLTKQRITAGF